MMSDFLNTEQALDQLVDVVGKIIYASTGLKVIYAGSKQIPKPEGEFAMIDQPVVIPVSTWEDNYYEDEDCAIQTHNYKVTFLVTVYRGSNPAAKLTKVQQVLNLPRFYDKFFPDNSQFAYAYCTTVSSQRVPLNQQLYENRATILLTFNMCAVESDTEAFEVLRKVGLDIFVTVAKKD